MKTISGDKAIFSFKQSSFLEIYKINLDCEAKLIDVYYPSNLNRVREHEAIAVSYAHAQRNSSNTMQLVEVFKKLNGEDCMSTTMIIKTAHKSIQGCAT